MLWTAGAMPGMALVPSHLAPGSGMNRQRMAAQSVQQDRGVLAVDQVDLLVMRFSISVGIG